MSTFCTGGRHRLYFILEDVKCSPKICNLCFCRAQNLVARALSSLVNTSVHSVIGAMPACTTCEFTKPHTEGATRTGVRFAAKVSSRLQTCVVIWRNIQESLSSNVTFAAASFVIRRITSDIRKYIQNNHS